MPLYFAVLFTKDMVSNPIRK